MYLLDADYSFAIAKNISDHLAERNHMKEVIIVGIAYAGPPNYRIHRTRDYTPTNSNEDVSFDEIQRKYSGGGPDFLSFIETELIPFMDKNFRTSSERTITGHSYGGLFSLWILLTKPELFTGYIVVSPSLWYDDRLMFRIGNNLTRLTNHKIKAYFIVGDQENWIMERDLKEFDQLLRSKKIKEIEIKMEIGINETHNSVFPAGLSNGLRFVYDGI